MAIGLKSEKQLADYADELVKAGRYASRDDVLKESLRLLELKERRRAELDAALERGLADVEAGRVIPADDVLAFFENKYASLEKGGDA